MRIEVINIFLSFGLLSDSIIVIQIVFMAPTMLDLSIYLLIYGRPQNPSPKPKDLALGTFN